MSSNSDDDKLENKESKSGSSDVSQKGSESSQ